MTNQQQVDQYLKLFRSHLRSMTLTQREEIVREIQAHIRDASETPGGSVAQTLAALGAPAALASEYSDGVLLNRARRSYSPALVLRAALRLSGKGLSGILVAMLAVFGYLIGAGMVASALMKPIFPDRTGVWVQNGRVIFSGTQFIPPQTGHEVLGWWYVPIGLIAGALLILITMFAIRFCLRISSRWQQLLNRPTQREAVRLENA